MILRIANSPIVANREMLKSQRKTQAFELQYWWYQQMLANTAPLRPGEALKDYVERALRQFRESAGSEVEVVAELPLLDAVLEIAVCRRD